VAGLATLAEEFSTSGAVDVELDLSVDPEVIALLSMTHRVQLLQMTREALSNATRHARAQHIRLSMQADEGALRLGVDDDGIGFDARSDPPAGHLGLANLRQRAAALGGVLTIDSSAGHGTHVGVVIPLDPEERPE
jgi:signal transduction histidine kinase